MTLDKSPSSFFRMPPRVFAICLMLSSSMIRTSTPALLGLINNSLREVSIFFASSSNNKYFSKLC